jgi:hypothetical protein
MKTLLKTFLITILPVFACAQDTTVVKHQAQLVADASLNGNYNVVASHTYPKIIEGIGGKDKMAATVKEAFAIMKAQGISIESATIGSPGKFYKAGTEIHCLVPEKMVLTTSNGKIVNSAYLLAISKDGGKYWYFLDINRSTYKLIPKLFPNFNKDLVIPEPTPPVMQ